MRRLTGILFLGLAALAAGCDRAPDAAPAAGETRTPAATGPVVLGDGVIAGRVNIADFKPSPTKSSQPFKCGDHMMAVADESVVLNDNGTLRNVVVYLKEAPPAGPTKLPPAVLDQVRCQYTPHVVALQTGQTLRIKSSDDTLHNVHARCEENPGVNIGMMGKGAKDLSFAEPERFRVKCDVHPWMNAHVAVLPHPYFAVTGDDGAFRITGVPAGDYTLVAWHEKFDELEQQITVSDETPAEASFTYRPPAGG